MRYPIELQRLIYWQGQRLLSRDARDHAAVEDELRWWHNRAIHNAYGVAGGLTLSVVHASGLSALDLIGVSQGLAYDCFGREVMLKRAISIALPPNPDDGWTLLIRYRENTEFPQPADVTGVYAPPICTIEEQAVVYWKHSGDVVLTDGVPLGDLELLTPGLKEKDGVLILSVSKEEIYVFVPESILARGLARPKVASGTTVVGNTSWGVWDHTSHSNRSGTRRSTLGAQVQIDTSAAGFTRAPNYFAWLQTGQTSEPFPIFVSFNQIVVPTLSSFIFRVGTIMTPMALPLGQQQIQDMEQQIAKRGFLKMFLAAAREYELYVSWIGIEPLNEPAEVEG